MRNPFFRRREVLVPTGLAWISLFLVFLTPALLWIWRAESFLSRSDRVAADVLVVEGWIGDAGVIAAADEFAAEGYDYVVVTGGWTGESWAPKRWSYVSIAHNGLKRAGVPDEKIILTPTTDAETQRTAAAAWAAVAALKDRGVVPKGVNVFTRGVHARRSQIVFSRAFQGIAPVGVVAWLPPGTAETPWWQQTYRIEDLIQETVGCLYEVCVPMWLRPEAQRVEARQQE